ncbi:MAG TPA: DUF4010 domain-containing protein [Dinghuibacter sp.]|uniref:MgtC/SapB family protein n=1 Tax=Dinghuibacter sp. TaxID=2024697 RepID=UPI002B57627C|nr:DUF4010 domain-containing protein [Dinghuibacter sp.]HTJ11589.1 DUF4010 domain-containing protein [Dinghuibacter sp.]
MPTLDHTFPAAPIALKMAVSVGIGMLVGLEREWSSKDVGVRTFSIVSLLGMLASLAGENFVIAGLVGVFLLVAAANTRSILTDRSLEITTSAALMVIYLLGVLVGMGHIFTPVAGAVIVTMLLAWKSELNRFAGGLHPSEVRSAVLMGLIGFVIYPILPDRYIDPWQLFNPSDAWLSIIAIAGIGFLNYVLLRVYSTRGLYLGAIFGGLVNSSAAVAEVSARIQGVSMASRATVLCLLATIAMCVRNLVLATLFAPSSLAATLLPLIAMALVTGLWIGLDLRRQGNVPEEPATLALDSPISLSKILRFGLLFIAIQVSGTLLTKAFGGNGLLATSAFGGLVSSASTTAAAATMARHGSISPSLAGSATVVASLASALVNLPIVWRAVKDKRIVRRLTWEMTTIIAAGIAAVLVDRSFGISERLMHP